jgi:peptidoglycan/LPS O-acetylase OafA/YrhL
MFQSRGTADSHALDYRADLDGLRAVAVSAVVAFHVDRDALPGGHLGVDMFFVLSGYLITSIIWREVARGTFSFAGFYDRRIRRILPALLLVVLVTGIASCVVLLPLDLVGFGRSVLAALGFVANLYFWRDTGYFAQLAEEKPLLHVWSLAVEEQFYLLFPVLLLGLARFMRRHVGAVIALLVVLSLAADALALAAGARDAAFYLLPTRAWQLGIGALLALTPAMAAGARWATPLGLAGLAAIATGLLAPSLSGPWVPDGLLPVAGTAMVIVAGREQRGAVREILGWRPLVFIGLISYSLYLWHWPIIVLSEYYLTRELSAVEAAIAVAAMLAAATASWHFVERPFRTRAMTTRQVLSAVLAGAAVAAAMAAAILATDGFPGRLGPAAARMNESVGTHYSCPVADYVYFARGRACALELPSRDPGDADIVLFGNSHAQMYAPLVGRLATAASRKVLLVPMNRCTPTLGTNIDPPCQALAERFIEGITQLPRAEVVMLVTTWYDPSTRAELVKGLDATIARLTQAGKKVVLVGPVSIPEWNLASVASRALAFGHVLRRPLWRERDAFDAEFAAVVAHFRDRPDVELVLPHEIQCDERRCHHVVDGRALFSDSTHLAANELGRFRPAFVPALRRALAPPAPGRRD